LTSWIVHGRTLTRTPRPADTSVRRHSGTLAQPSASRPAVSRQPVRRRQRLGPNARYHVGQSEVREDAVRCSAWVSHEVVVPNLQGLDRAVSEPPPPGSITLTCETRQTFDLLTCESRLPCRWRIPRVKEASLCRARP